MKPIRCLVLPLVAVLALSGCVTRGYKLADNNIPAAVTLNLTSVAVASPSQNSSFSDGSADKPAPVLATLQSVIVYQGPGSWKREAYWDEYVVTLHNRGDIPLAVATARLHDGKGDPLVPGDDPWALERFSKNWWETNAVRQTGTYLALGAGTMVGAGMAVFSAMGSGIISSASGAAVAGGAGAAAIGAAAVVTLPLIAGGTIYLNLHRKHQVEAEFDRRRLELPVTLTPGQTVQGSLFFRITPSPQRLSFGYRTGREPLHATINLAPLSGLHIKSASPMAPRPEPAPDSFRSQ